MAMFFEFVMKEKCVVLRQQQQNNSVFLHNVILYFIVNLNLLNSLAKNTIIILVPGPTLFIGEILS